MLRTAAARVAPLSRAPARSMSTSAGALFLHRTNLPVNFGVLMVPQQEAWIVERFGRFHRLLEPGLRIAIPFVDRVRYRHSLKETAIEVPNQSAITKDNVSLHMDGVLYYRVVDPYKASYGVEDPRYAVSQMAVTTMRSEIGKITLDKTFEERDMLNHAIVTAINHAAEAWGVNCMRYEIRDIEPPTTVVNAMELQVAAERKKRAQILDSQGSQQAEINLADGGKQATVLASEASMTRQINEARGEAEAILLRAKATAAGLKLVSSAINSHGTSAVAMRLAEQYIEAFQSLAKTNNTVLLPAQTGDPAGMVAQALGVYKTIQDSSAHQNINTGHEIDENQLQQADQVNLEAEKLLQEWSHAHRSDSKH